MSRKVKQAEFQPSGEVKRIIPLGDNNWAYLVNHEGKTMHFNRLDPLFVQECIKTNEKMSGKVVRDLDALGWTDVVEKMGALEDGNINES